MSNIEFRGPLQHPETAAPSTPPSGFGVFYTNTSGVPHHINDAGTDSDLTTGTGGGEGVAPYATTIGDGSTTTFVITHGLGTKDVLVHVYSLTSPFPAYVMSPDHTSTNTITLTFTTAPATNSVRVVVAAYAGISLTEVDVRRVNQARTANLNPNPGAEVDTSFWSGVAATISRDTGTMRTGVASFKVTATGSSDNWIRSDEIAVLPGDPIRVSAWVLQGTGTSGDEVITEVEWFDSSHTLIGSAGRIWEDVFLGASWANNQVTRTLGAGTAPTGAAYARVTIRRQGSGSVSDTWFVDDIDIWKDGVLVTNNITYNDPAVELRIGDRTEATTGRIIIETGGAIHLECDNCMQNMDGGVFTLDGDDITIDATDDLNLNFLNLFLNGVEAAWIDYTPTMSWTLGNGKLHGRYININKKVTYVGQFEYGSTSSPSGALRISVPVTPRSDAVDLREQQAGHCFAQDASASFARTIAACQVAPFAYGNNLGFASNGNTDFTSTAPFTWATGDGLFWAITYEAA